MIFIDNLMNLTLRKRWIVLGQYQAFIVFYNTEDIILGQELPNNETDINKLIKRFEIFCYCAKNCKMKTRIDIIVLWRTLKLLIRTSKLDFIHIVWINFIFGLHPYP